MAGQSAVRFAGVPEGGSVTILSPLGRAVRRLPGRDGDGLWGWDLRSERDRAVATGVYLALVRDAHGRAISTLRLVIAR
jgi:hypothetical protein